MDYIYIYLIIINIISFIMFFIDKVKSVKKKWRISEFNLMLLCFIGGSLGGFISMYTFRHKTKKLKFVILVPLLIIAQLILIFGVFR